MMTAEALAQFRSLVENAQTICVFFPADASPDVVLSAVSLGRGLASLGKSVSVLSPEAVDGQLSQFAGVSEVATEIGNKNLDVSFPYKAEQVDKVSYHIDEEAQMFHLVIQPQKGVKPLDASAVQFAMTGAEADLMITIAVDRLDQLDQLYYGYEQLFEGTNTISSNTYETNFGTLKIATAGSASYGEVMHQVLQDLQATEDPELATNLLAAIESATQTFRSLAVTAQTFETASKMLELGARRVRLESEAPREIQASMPAQNGSVTFADAMVKGKKTPVKRG